MDKKDKITLDPGETFCPQCKGSGKDKSWSAGGFEITPECPKCLGEGKFDWIQRIMGKRPRIYGVIQGWVDKAAKNLADEIDKEILENFIDAYGVKEEHNIK